MFQDSEILERFIVIEGLDGAGTSTQRSLLCQAIKARALPCHETWEPTDGPVGRLIRQVLRQEIHVNAATLCRLFAADRAEHCQGKDGIESLCRGGTWVVSDRYIFSSLAYQGLSQDMDWIAGLNAGFPLPHYLFFVDVDAETAHQRRDLRGESPELFDHDPVQAAVRRNYHQIMDQVAADAPMVRLCRLDGRDSIAGLHHKICTFLEIPPIEIQ